MHRRPEGVPIRVGKIEMGYGALVLFCAAGLAFQTWAAQPEKAGVDCSSCHEEGKTVAKSAHAPVGCAECHLKREQYPHPADAPKPDCAACHAQQAGEHARSAHGQALKRGNGAAPDCSVCHGKAHETIASKTAEFHRGVPDTCGMCHGEVLEKFKRSVHGKAVERGIVDAPVCTDCHGEHSILPPKDRASTVSAGKVPETCGRCHADVRLARRFGLPPDRITSFQTSFHGLALKAGSQTVANCASCHGYHDILPSTDPASMTHPNNLAKTCGSCHPGAGTRFALGKVHWVEGQSEPWPVRIVRVFYLTMIPATIGLFLLHHAGDFIRKLIRTRLSIKAMPVWPSSIHPHEIRMYPLERFQHALLAVSFIVLIWSGFALKYPDQFWAKPLVIWESQYPVRGVVHRVAAVVMIIAGVLHVLSLILSKRLREHWKHLWPKRSDVHEATAMFLYNLGLRRTKPAISSHSYVEKAEYWAVVWGTFIMGLTGIMLWANNFTLRWLPKEWLDAATAVHFYEAVLAGLSILIWHFYTVIFDPEVYPVDPAFLNGYSVRQRHQTARHAPPPEAAEGD